MIEALERILNNHGIAVMALCAIGGGVFLAGRYMLKRLFDQDHGIVSKVVSSHVEFVTQQSTHNAAMQAKQATMATELKGSADKLDALHAAGRDACDVLDIVCNKLGVAEEARRHIANLRETLNHQ